MTHSQIIANADLNVLKDIAEQITENLPVKITREPNPGMVMIKHIDP